MDFVAMLPPLRCAGASACVLSACKFACFCSTSVLNALVLSAKQTFGPETTSAQCCAEEESNN
eukprot:1199405-Amphidinium_carterae.1